MRQRFEDYIVYQGQAGLATYDPWVTMAATAGQRHEALMLRKLMEAGAVKRTGRGRPRIRPAARWLVTRATATRVCGATCAGGASGR